MAANYWTKGFELGSAQVQITPDLSEGLDLLYKKEAELRKKAEEEQKKFDDAREKFIQASGKTMEQYIYENQFDGTGISDVDAVAEKFKKQVREQYELNEFAFRNGFIDENEMNKRNASLKGQVNQLSGMYEKIEKALDKKQELDQQGKGNSLNDLVVDYLEAFSKDFNASTGMYGLSLSTIKDGERKEISTGVFDGMLNMSEGVNLNTIYDDLITKQGYAQYIQSGKKVTKYTEQEGDMTALDAKIASMSEAQKLGAMLDLGIASSNKEEADKNGLIFIDVDRAVDPEASDEEMSKLKEAMHEQLKGYQQRKQKEEIYKDPNRVKKTASQSVKEDTMRAAYEIALKIGEGGEDANRLVDQVVANNEGIENIFLDEASDSYIVETVDKKGKRSDFSIKVPRNEDGSVDSRNLGVSLMSAISPTYSVEQAELAARDFEKKNPDYQFSTSTSVFDRDYIPMPSLNSVQVDKNTFASDLITSTDADDLMNDMPKALSALGIDRGYKIETAEIPETRGIGPFQVGIGNKNVIKITIPNTEQPIFIAADDKQQIIEMIPDIAYKIKKAGNLIDNRSNRVESSGRKALPGKK